ncbi:hypothetical protein NL676_004842 [Syzygium grande]|nr:hypothetical protein NL676_004842 [Syzygium grande]
MGRSSRGALSSQFLVIPGHPFRTSVTMLGITGFRTPVLQGCSTSSSNHGTAANDPVVIWLTGGPGCSSELALFYENGPFHIANNLSLVWNDYGWDKVSNIIFVDQPTGTGFSYSSDESDIRHDEQGVSNDLYDFSQAFFAAHPQLVKNDFYITGESYAGHYIPAFAARVQQGNKAKEGIHINLKGFAIGNGLTNPEIQYGAYTDYALDMKLITQSDHDSIDTLFPKCKQAIQQCATKGGDECEIAFTDCHIIFTMIKEFIGNTNYYDIRKSCEGSLCYDFSNMETFLNQKTVRDALGVGDIGFVSCSSTVYNAMLQDWMKNLEAGIPALLEDGLKETPTGFIPWSGLVKSSLGHLQLFHLSLMVPRQDW